MNPATKKKIGIGVGVVVALLALGLAVFLLKRQELLEYALREVKTKVEKKYPVTLTLGPARFTDLNTVRIDGVALVPAGSDTLLQARRINASISLKTLFARRPVFSDLQIDSARLTARKTETTDNYSFFFAKKKAPVRRDTTQGANYGLLLNQLLETAFDNVPGEADFRNFLVTYRSPDHNATLTMPRFAIEDGDLTGQLTADIDSVVNTFGLQGHIEPGDYALEANVYGLNGRPVLLPYVQRRYGARVQFDTVRVSLSDKDLDDDQLTVRGTAWARNFVVNHPKLADHDVRFPRAGIDYVATLGKAYGALENGTKITLNRMEFFPEISVRKLPRKQRLTGKANGVESPDELLAGLQVKVNIKSGETKANDFFAALPEGMFSTLEGTQGEGTLTYRLLADLDMNQLDSLKFSSSLTGKNFRLTRFGREDLGKLNTPFAYTAYNDKGDSIKTFQVGPPNPEFVPFNQVSQYLKHAILTAEDPRFFTHKGFMAKAFVNSIIQNIKEKRFARGGSTISMQLVKNVFLTRQKTVTRKIEEALIVWLIENTRVATKERMMEVYLNIIEWGPKIYGVTEAARFYFSKQPNELTLSESLYLASIIPRPKLYRLGFNQYGDMRRSARYFHRLIAQLMARKGYISQDEYESLGYSVNFSNPSRMGFIPRPDTTRTVVAADSSQYQPLNLIDLLGGGADEGVNTNTPVDAGTAAPAQAPPKN
ncbi:transglycosylase domain-containing protein [Hymenobacter guriensis]|uniref:Transglycosylase domain-containing protein n=1 Tax=Hymenobacter guriensis TaxID=2793065 RepID=A0ABS0L6I3_9BACT|nr:biosynthetic peptidoglycan transglycosylase [Hymenobacter guriensis]MBG8555709.1 transglycosylase domain-containing protein [Hymenobacter guriensis]